ncbi:MAG: restriction endonuclease subunit S [Isosphaeraceae bacterium]|nr:restriction endonuclease subunit S [Isosphaeraceae bacterium]
MGGRLSWTPDPTDVPEGWRLRTLGEIGRLKSGSGFPLRFQGAPSGLYPFLKVSDMNLPANGRVIHDANHWIGEQDRLSMGAAVHPVGSVIFAKVGAAIFLERKRILSMPSCLDNNMMSLALNRDLVDPTFLQYALSYRSLGDLVSTTALPALSAGTLRGQVILVPTDPSEQRAIAGMLERADRAVEDLQRLLEKVLDLREAALCQLVSGSIRLPGYIGDWPSEPFHGAFRVVSIRGHQLQTDEYQELGRLPIVDQGKDLIAGYTDRIDLRIAPPAGTAIVFGDHTCIVKYVDFDFVAGADGTKVLVAAPGWNARFLAYHLEFRGVQPTGYNRHFKYLKVMSFRRPELEEQAAIAAVIAEFDAQAAALRREIEKLRDLTTAMAQDLLSGRSRLT